LCVCGKPLEACRISNSKEIKMNADAVFWGAIICVVGAVIVVVAIGVKVSKMMKEDAQRHSNQ